MPVKIRVSAEVDDRRGNPPRFVTVSEEDAILVRQYQWVMGRGPNPYAVAYRRNGLRLAHPAILHRIIIGAGPKQIVDHIDRNTSNNTRENLRIVTHAENMRNRRPNQLWSKAGRASAGGGAQ